MTFFWHRLCKKSNSTNDAKKCRLGPQNGPRSLGPEKLLKIANLE